MGYIFFDPKIVWI